MAPFAGSSPASATSAAGLAQTAGPADSMGTALPLGLLQSSMHKPVVRAALFRSSGTVRAPNRPWSVVAGSAETVEIDPL